MMKTPEQIIQEQVNTTKPRGGLGGLLDYAKTRNNDTGLSRMQNFAAALDPLIMPEMRAGEGIRERGAQRVAAGNKNKTIQMLIDRGREDLANLVKSGAITAQQAASVLLAPSKDNRIALQKRAELAGLVPGTPEYQTFMLQGGVSSGGAPAQFGAIPAGYQLIEGVDESGNKSYSMQPVPGSKAAIEAEAAIGAEETGKKQELATAGVIVGNIDKIKEKLNSTTLPITGFAGSNLKKIAGTNAYAVSTMLNTIKANIGFDKLNAMRKASPTGGALGQVSEKELMFLQSVLVSLDQGLSAEDFGKNLGILENRYNDVISKFNAYPEDAKKEAGYSNVSLDMPENIGTVDFSTMTDEQLKKYIADNENK